MQIAKSYWRFVLLALIVLAVCAHVGRLQADDAVEASTETPSQLVWHDNYADALHSARANQRMLFIFFYNTGEDRNRDAFEQKVLTDPKIQAKLADYELARLPVDAANTAGGETYRLLDHPSFAEMLKRQGVAVVDLSDKESPHYHHVVSTFPFTPRTYYPVKKIDTILGLPAGSLTQRTLIYAVRMHPDAPQSAWGKVDDVLASEAMKHSQHQAAIRLQGHHNWDSRFHQISSQLPGGLVPVEVAAESWPGETLVEAAEECVHCWRQSSGHWNAVRGRHPLFGFDMKRGGNGIWYATGLFGKNR